MRIIYIIFSLVFASSLHAQIITTIAGNGTPGFSGEGGPAVNAKFGGVEGVAVDKHGNIYMVDAADNVVEKIDTNGILTRFAGNGSYGFSPDGGLAVDAPLLLYGIVGIAVDTENNVYFADGSRVRKVNTSGIITTVAGNTSHGYSGDGGPATLAELSIPIGICFDNNGNLFIADKDNNNVRVVNAIGIISTYAGGTFGFSGDGGPATNAQLWSPLGIVCDNNGNLFIADIGNFRIRKVSTSGIITTVAGGSTFGVSFCEGCPATSLDLFGPSGMAVDASGNIFLSDATKSIIYKVTEDAEAYTIVGNGMDGYSGDGGPASVAELNAPVAIRMDNSGNLLIADKHNYRLRKVWLGTNYVAPIHNPLTQFLVYPNPISNKNFTCKITTDTNEEVNLIIRNIIGQRVFSSTCSTNIAKNFSINVPAGLYFITAITSSYKTSAKLVVE